MADMTLSAVITAEDKASSVIKGMGGNINSTVTKIGLGMAAVGAGITLVAKKATEGVVDFYKESKNLARITGETTEESSRLLQVMKRVGIDSENAAASFGIFSRNITQATEDVSKSTKAQRDLKLEIKNVQLELVQTQVEVKKHGDKTGELALKTEGLKNKLSDLQEKLKGATNAFDRIGVATTDAGGKQRDFESILLDVADRFKAMPNGIDKTALAMELFGRQGKDMIKILNLGSSGIRDMESQADKLGLTLNANTVGSIARLVASQKKLKEDTESMKIAIGTATAPVLTAFNEKLNQVLTTLLRSNGPLKTITADFLAFSGPVLTATGGLISFISNAVQAAPAISKLLSSAGALSAFFTGPWAIAIAGVGLGIGILADRFVNHTAITDRLAASNRQLKVDMDAVKTAQDQVAQSDLAKQGADLAVEQAQRNYNDAVKRFGASSLEARQASYDLATANDNARRAADSAKTAHQQLGDELSKQAKDTSMNQHLQALAKDADSVTNSALAAGTEIRKFDGSKITVKTSKSPAGVQTVDFVSTFGKRAAGGPVLGGSGYIVGEQGPEVFVPSQSGAIIPNNKIGGPSSIININLNAGAFMGSDVEARKYAQTILNHMHSIAGAKNMTLGQMIGS